jgi:hypothetical protein
MLLLMMAGAPSPQRGGRGIQIVDVQRGVAPAKQLILIFRLIKRGETIHAYLLHARRLLHALEAAGDVLLLLGQSFLEADDVRIGRGDSTAFDVAGNGSVEIGHESVEPPADIAAVRPGCCLDLPAQHGVFQAKLRLP